VPARDKCGQNLQLLVPVEVSYDVKHSVFSNEFPSLIWYIPAITGRLFFVKNILYDSKLLSETPIII
jgi:hypothetical protein